MTATLADLEQRINVIAGMDGNPPAVKSALDAVLLVAKRYAAANNVDGLNELNELIVEMVQRWHKEKVTREYLLWSVLNGRRVKKRKEEEANAEEADDE